MQFGRRIISEQGFVNGLMKPGFLAGGAAVGIGAIGRVGVYPFVRDGMLQSFGIE
jgi:hypothetical protein